MRRPSIEAQEKLYKERMILRNMKIGDTIVYHNSEEPRVRERFDAARLEDEEGYGFAVQKKVSSVEREVLSPKTGKMQKVSHGVFDYIYIRSSKY